MPRLIFTVLATLFSVVCAAQTLLVKGHVKDPGGEPLPHAYIMLDNDSVVAMSETDGSFSFRAKRGRITLSISFIGFEKLQTAFELRRDTVITFLMNEKAGQLEQVVVTSQKYHQVDIFESVRSSVNVVTKEDINSIPVLGGEADVIKTLQLLPGTLRGVEGSSDLFVRGGAADQNLVLLDQAPIYNTSHLFGFLSVFNPDILDKVEAINGGFPAQYGGRLSSILDIKTNSDIAAGTHLTGDIGLLASRIYLEQPIIKNKMSFWISGRRTYIDQVVKAIGEELPYYFYDLNGKLIIRPTDRDNVELTYYGGEDLLDYFRDRNNDGDGITTSFQSGNNSQVLQWNRYWNRNWSSNLSLIRSSYRYNVRNTFGENRLIASSDIEDLGVKMQVAKDSVLDRALLSAGIDWTRHQLSPGVVSTTGIIAEFIASNTSNGHTADEFAAHTQLEIPVTDRLLLNMGLRTSVTFVKNRVYIYPEPRIAARYTLDKNNAIKLSYSRMTQYMHRVSSSAITSPTDIWYPVTKDILPQTSNQVGIAWQRMLPATDMFLSVETYYKQMNNLIGYEEGTNLFLNTDFESKLIQGNGRAYGLELLLKKESGRFTGWVSYTLSWSQRRFEEINNGHWFYSRYDRRNNGAIVAQYAFTKRLLMSMVWEFISGSRFTPVIGQYTMFAPAPTGADLIPLYADINSVKLSDTHRLDLGIKWKSKPGRRFQWQWFVGVYNVYNRASPIGINVVQDEQDGSLHYEQPGLFGLLPFISYGFRF